MPSECLPLQTSSKVHHSASFAGTTLPGRGVRHTANSTHGPRLARPKTCASTPCGPPTIHSRSSGTSPLSRPQTVATIHTLLQRWCPSYPRKHSVHSAGSSTTKTGQKPLSAPSETQTLLGLPARSVHVAATVPALCTTPRLPPASSCSTFAARLEMSRESRSVPAVPGSDPVQGAV